ncbi:hypothetical protein GCM10009676_18380 [Prauserella halophila]|uniref:Uncharacterized protein n=1 Tax=Prauserella halophila TaxID=185641 RepID=A0ABP4GXF4_9PSEU|nr:hypothetical protein [Prauserella halophila]MCP2235959.1 hypothetical protein [Prauserella halophila]
MNIQEQAQQLAALADQVPDGQAQAIVGELEGLRQQVAAVLGDTSSAQEIHGAIGQAVEQLTNVSAMLEQVKQVVVEKANHHQQG